MERTDPNGLTITPQVSHDLINWQADPGDESFIRILSTTDDNAGRTVTAAPAPGHGRLFFRLSVARQ